MWFLTLEEKLSWCSRTVLVWYVIAWIPVLTNMFGNILLILICVMLVEVFKDFYHLFTLQKKGERIYPM